MELKQHPLSAAFPSMPEAEFSALVEDIRKHGQRDPILIHEGQVLDGWHRYRACTEIGITPKKFGFGEGDPVAFVESVNLHRRHLTASQRAMAVVTLKQWAPAGKPNVATVATLAATNDEMATEAKVSPRMIRHAKTAQKAGLTEPVRDGAMTLAEAANVARGKPTPAPKAAAPTHAIPPAEDFGPTSEEVAAAQREQEEELAALRKIALADDKLAAALKEAEQTRAMNRVLTERNNGLMNEKAELVRRIKSLQRKLDKLEQPA